MHTFVTGDHHHHNPNYHNPNYHNPNYHRALSSFNLTRCIHLLQVTWWLCSIRWMAQAMSIVASLLALFLVCVTLDVLSHHTLPVTSRHHPSPPVTSHHHPLLPVTSRHQPLLPVTSRHQPSPAVITRHQPSPPVITRYYPSPAVTSRHHPSPPITASGQAYSRLPRIYREALQQTLYFSQETRSLGRDTVCMVPPPPS